MLSDTEIIIYMCHDNKSINDAVLIRFRQTSSHTKNVQCNIYVNFISISFTSKNDQSINRFCMNFKIGF